MTFRRNLLAVLAVGALIPAAFGAEPKPEPRSREAGAKRREGPGADAEHARLQREIDLNRALLEKLLQSERDHLDLMLKLMQQQDHRTTGGEPRTGGGEAAAAMASPPAPEPRPGEPERAEPPAVEPGGSRGSGTRSRAPQPGNGVLAGKLTVQGGGSVADAVVFVADVRGRPLKNNTLTIRQVNKQFVPRMAVVPRGTKIEFPNEDTIFHNAFSLSPGNSFDLGTYRAGDKPGAVVMNTPGVVKVFCNIHSQMSASILVVPGTLYSQVKSDGTFRIVGIPPGRHQVTAWLPNTEPVTREVEVAPGENGVDLALAVKGEQAHTNKFGQPYGSYAE